MKILVPTDFSPQSEAATEFAVSLARLTNGKVVLHHVFSTLIDWVAVPVGEEEQYPEVKAQLGHARQRLHSLAHQYPDVDISTELSFYETIDELLADVCKEKIDLIVMGTHGRKDLSNRLLGSDTQRVVRLASCPVLIVQDKPPRLPFRKLLFVADFREDLVPTLRRLLDLADAMKAEVELGFINTPVEFQNTADVETRMSDLAKAFPDRQLRTHIYDNVRVDTGIRQLTGRIGADAICMATHGRKGWSRLLYHSLTESLALDSDVPVISLHLS